MSKTRTMRYRIKITTFKSGRKEYTSQVKALIGWSGLDYDGNRNTMMFPQITREGALARIDKHFDGNGVKQSIEFQYITKQPRA